MARVAFIDCATTWLITRTGQYLPPGSRVLIRQPSAAVRRVLDITGLGSRCEIDEEPANEPCRHQRLCILPWNVALRRPGL
jgi:hypothetical protein